MPISVSERSREKIRDVVLFALSSFSDIRLITVCVVVLSSVLALLLRLAPMRWGIYLNEFDPFYEYYLAQKLLEKGEGDLLKGLAWWFNWWFNKGERDTLFWAPYGRDLRASSQLGAPLFSAAIYSLLVTLGFEVDLYTVHAFIPAVGAATASIFIYLFARDLWDSSSGVLASLFIACSWPFLYRTNLGAKHEGIAIPLILFSLDLLVRAARKGSVTLGFLSGVVMSLVVLSWGGFLYPWNLVSLVVLFWLVLNPEAVNVSKAFLSFIGPVNLTIAAMPRFGPNMAFASLAAVVPWLAIIMSILSVIHKIPSQRVLIRLERSKIIVIIAGVAGVLVLGWYFGFLARLPGRIIAVLFPVLREVGVTTVAEHAVPTWSSFYRDYGFLLPVSAFGALVAGFRFRKRFEDTLTIFLWASSAYAAASMARLTLILTPSVAMLAAFGLSEIFSVLSRLREPKVRAKKSAEMGVEIVLMSAIIVAALPLFSLANWDSISATHQPALILTSSVPVVQYNFEYTDWLSALEWINANVPANSVIATWWDYGYWISVNTGKNSTCDNATIDTKQIQKIARAFLSSEEEALRIFRELNVSYVVVYEPFLKAQLSYFGYVHFSPAAGGLGGDLAKSYQMARWIGLDPDRFLNVSYIDGYPVLVPADTPEARNATLYRMLFVKTPNRYLFIFEPTFYGSPISNYRGSVLSIEPPKYFKLVYASRPNEWVLVFKVQYPQSEKGE
ncbi:MAG: hypothetical protein NZ954_03190 [Thermofilaceae archaeon]|nr:hypothetical protein [Thermofilaceae archaeon]MCX8181059.1 hypothetical protein [Thermofilaceae archaeon]MDW8004540.1 STT3 domain-containing protein [Thermofilaceae archaeon]